MKFNYQARTASGEIQSGQVEASSKEAALTLLQKYGLYITYLEEVELEPFYAKRLKIFERITKQEITAFFRQLAVMFKSKVPIIEALYAIAKQTKNSNFREKLLKIAQEVEGGTSFSQALNLYPSIFNYFYVSMVKSGEVSGKLADTLEYLANHIEREYFFLVKIRGAMIYPIFVLFVFIVVIVAMTIFIIPQMSLVLAETGQELPLLTKAIIGISNFFRSWGGIILLLLISLIIFAYYYSKTPEGKKFFDKFWLSLPIIGAILKKIYLSRFAESLSTLITAGLPISQALEISTQVVGNSIYQNIIFEAREGIRRGEQISLILEQHPKFVPSIFYQMVLTGEKTGNLDEILLNITNYYRREIEENLNTIVGLLEPILIIILGGLVGIIVASILMPLYRIGGLGI